MSDLIKETVTVAQVGQWGVRIGDQWCGVNEPLEPSSFVPGNTYTILSRVGKPTPKNPQGKKYISQIVADAAPVAVNVATNVGAPAVTSVAPVAVPGPRIQEEDPRGRRILRQGIFQAVVQSPALPGFAATVDEYVALVVNISEKLIKEVEK